MRRGDIEPRARRAPLDVEGVLLPGVFDLDEDDDEEEDEEARAEREEEEAEERARDTEGVEETEREGEREREVEGVRGVATKCPDELLPAEAEEGPEDEKEEVDEEEGREPLGAASRESMILEKEPKGANGDERGNSEAVRLALVPPALSLSTDTLVTLSSLGLDALRTTGESLL